MSGRHLLVIEDDAAIRRGIADALALDGFSVSEAEDADGGLALALELDVDLVLLDLVLPGDRVRHGLEVLEQVRRERPTMPVIILTALGDEADRVRGLRLGADDYVVKPFAIGELLARIRALMRRVMERPTSKLEVGELSMDPATDYVVRGDRKIVLTAREFALFLYFMQNPDKILSRTLILENVWDSNYEGLSNVVDVYINNLRNKLEENGEPRIILTVRGRGYVLKESADET